MNEEQAKKVIELLERNNELLGAIAQAMIQENEENRALMDLVLNKPKKDPFAAFNNQKMMQAARQEPPPTFPYS